MRRLLLEIWYRIKSPMFLGAVLLSAAAFFAPLTRLLDVWAEEVFDLTNLYGEAVPIGIICTVAPCIAVLPNIKRFAAFKGDTMKYELMRCGKGRRMVIEAAVAAITGGLALWLGPVLVQTVLRVCGCPIIGRYGLEFYAEDFSLNASFSNLFAAERYEAYNAAKLSLFFLYGMTVNMMAFAICTMISDSYVIAFVPAILIENMDIWLGRYSFYFQKNTYITGDLINLPYDNTVGFWLVLFSIQCGVWLLCLLISAIIMNRRLRYA